MVQFLNRLQHLLTISYVHLTMSGSKSIMRIRYCELDIVRCGVQSETNYVLQKFCL